MGKNLYFCSMKTPQLSVYKASAGSGKTFRLASSFIKLLVDNPLQYKNILAVTFTNKATEEMKMRILSQLYGIWKGLPSSRSYMDEVAKSLGMGEEQIRQRAGTALRLLLHNYTWFKVETIDSFFQSVMRNLARELDLAPNLRVGLNDLQVEEEAVDQLIENLGKDDPLLKWIIDYIHQNIDEDKAWNVIGLIKKFGKTIFSEKYKAESEELKRKLDNPNFLPDYVKELKAKRKEAEQTMAGYATQFLEILENAGLQPEDLNGKGRGIAGYFNKLRDDDLSDKKCRTKTLNDYLTDASSWAAKKSPNREVIVQLAEDRLMPLLNRAEADRPRMWKTITSVKATLGHLSQLRLLGAIEKEVSRLNNEANRFLLSNTQQLLHELIDGSDTPFIFEKTGTQLEHIMIDEFQDTSTVQWENFKILLQETMSRTESTQSAGEEGLTGNLIVGDVKQSIYRWRNGDWRLLNGIERQFAGGKESVKVESLDTNWRSAANIVEFNNAFFKKAADIEYLKEKEINEEGAEELKRAYDHKDVEQKLPEKKTEGGMVRIKLLPAEDYDDAMLEELGQVVDELTANGIGQRKIAILVRTNRFIPLIASYFRQTREHIRIVSDEAFKLDASLAVNIIVSAMRCMLRPDDELAKAHLEKAYRHINGKGIGDLMEREMDNLRQLPVTDLVERLCQLLGADNLHDQSAYVFAFQDQVATFAAEYGTDIEKLLSLWDEDIHKKTIQSDVAEGIRIISIHKSKGLEFDNVIIPYCDWDTENTLPGLRPTLWCRPQEAPFSKLPLVPVDYSPTLTTTIYAADYITEHLQNCVDNLNLLYVAFTRAARNLFVIGKRDTKGRRSQLVQEVLCSGEMGMGELEGAEDQEAPMVFTFGELLRGKEEKKEETDNVFLTTPTPHIVDMETYDTRVDFRQSNKSRDFADSLEEGELSEQAAKRQQYIKTGNVLHQLFAQIHTVSDIPAVLKRFEFEGILYNEDISAEELKAMIEERLADNRVAAWFSDKWQLYNECKIIGTDENGNLQEHRPDRVMTDGKETIVVDFKFGVPREEYHRQVASYMQLLSDMGHTNVSGFLWYVYGNTIEEVFIE